MKSNWIIRNKWKLSLTYKISFSPNLFCAKEEIVSYLEFLSQITHKFRKSTNTPIRDFIFISSFHPSNFESFKNSLSQFNCWIASGKCFNTFSACKKKLFHGLPTPLSQQYLRISSIYRMSASETRECQVIATMLHTVGSIKSTTI